MPKFGDLLLPRAGTAQGTVSFTGPDPNGLVKWTLQNTGSAPGSWVLKRGAAIGGVTFEDYVFGQAFNVIYLNNPNVFGVRLLSVPPTPLVDVGAEANVPPMGIVDAPTGRSICFVFTLAPGQTWSMFEGGFSGGVTPTNPVLVPVTVKDAAAKAYCDEWNSEQCAGFNSQADTNYPCPPNPWSIEGILLETSAEVPIYVADTITTGPCSSAPSPCSAQLTKAVGEIEAGDFESGIEDLFAALFCFIDGGAVSLERVLRSFLLRARKARARETL